MFAINNKILDTDSYKFSHPHQYPPGTTEILSYLESRGGPGADPGTIFFGLQFILKELSQPISILEVEEAKAFVDKHIGPDIFPYDGWKYIVNELEGKLPLEIKAIPEGTYVPSHNALMTVRCTDPKVFWLNSWMETQLMRLWYPINVATISNSIRKLIYSSLLETSDDPEGQILFKLCDFGSRGVSSRESAAIGGAAHLINFLGSDTVVGIEAANYYYGSEMAGFSIPAAEHSTITTWGPTGEADAFRNMLTKFAKPGALVAVVSDSYDLDHAVREIWGGELRQEVIDSGATIIVRPDSGKDIPAIVVRTAQNLAEKFGYTTNSKGYKVLNNVRVIQGDGIEEGVIRLILYHTKQAGFATDNFAFGMGGALLQKHDRDTYKFAYKACLAKIDGEYRHVFKDPATDPGKRSKSGMLDLILLDNNEFATVDRLTNMAITASGAARNLNLENIPSQLETVFQNGRITKITTLDEIRTRITNRIQNMAHPVPGENVA